MARFTADKTREESLKSFIHSEVYPQVVFAFEEVTDADKQKAGHDAKAIFDWGTETNVIDEKAQNSNKYIGDPCPTFVLELFGESWEDRHNYGNIGWYLDSDNQTDYYVFVWLPDVSLFRINTNFDVIEYHPGDAVEFTVDTLMEHAYTEIEHQYKRTRNSNGFDHYKLRFTATNATEFSYTGEGWNTDFRRDIITAFDNASDPLPEIFRSETPIQSSEWYYDPCHVHEAKVLIVEKEKIESTLANAGLDKQTLKNRAVDLIESGETVDVVEQPEAMKIIRSKHSTSGCDETETPVNLVVNYDTYHRVADKTLHYVNDTWKTDVCLF